MNAALRANLAKALGKEIKDAHAHQALDNEIKDLVRENISKAKRAFKANDFELYQKIKLQSQTLLDWRHALTHLTDEQDKLYVRQNILKVIEATREAAEDFSVPRLPSGQLANFGACTIPAMYALHQELRDRLKDGADLPSSCLDYYQHAAEQGLRKAMKADDDIKCSIFLKLNAAMFTPGPGSESELYFSIYKRGSEKGEPGTFLTEEYLVNLSENGMPKDPDMFDQMHVIFEDLTRATLAGDAYMVCRIYRVGVMTTQPTGGFNLARMGMGLGGTQDDSAYRRPFAVCVTKLDGLSLAVDGATITVTADLRQGSSEDDFANVHRYLIDRDDSNVEKVSVNGRGMDYSIAIDLQVLDGDAESIPTKEGSQHMAAVPHAMITALPQNFDIKLRRNEIYFTLQWGRFSQNRKTSPRNIFVRILCLSQNGVAMPWLQRGMGPMSESTSEYNPTVFYHNNSPVWDETICMQIPEDKEVFESVHLLVLTYHASQTKENTLLGFTWLDLTSSDGVVLENRKHEIEIYEVPDVLGKAVQAMDKQKGSESAKIDPSVYRGQRDSLEARTVRTLTGAEKSETMSVKVNVCSTVKSPHGDIHDLLNWQDVTSDGPEPLHKILKSMMDYGKSDIARFLPEIFSSVIGAMLRFKDDERTTHECFALFVHLLGMFRPKKGEFKESRDVLVTYIKENSRGTGIHGVLISALSHYVDWFEDITTEKLSGSGNSKAKVLGNALVSLNLLVRFVQASKSGDGGDSGSNDGVTDLSEQLSAVICKISAVLVEKAEDADHALVRNKKKQLRDQTIKIWPDMIPLLGSLFTPVQFATIAATLLQNLPYVVSASRRKTSLFNVDRLQLIFAVVKQKMFKDAQSRAILSDRMIHCLKEHLTAHGNLEEDERKLSCLVLHLIFQVAEEEDDAAMFKRMVSLLPELLLLNAEHGDVTEAAALARSKRASTGDAHKSIMGIESLGKETELNRNYWSTVDLVQDSRQLLMNFLCKTTQDTFTGYFEAFRPDMAVMKDHLLHFLQVLCQIEQEEAMPSSWMLMLWFQRKVVVKVLGWALQILRDNFQDDLVEGQDSEMSLWHAFFRACFILIRNENLDWDKLPQVKKDILTENDMVDVRAGVIAYTMEPWELLRGQHLLLADYLIPETLLTIQSGRQFVTDMAGRIYFDMIKADFLANGVTEETGKAFTVTGGPTIDAVDEICTQLAMAEHSESKAERRLERRASSVVEVESISFLKDKLLGEYMKDDPVLGESANYVLCEAFVTDLCQLFWHLRSIQSTDLDEDRRALAYKRLLDYLMSMQRPDYYTHYAHKLADEYRGKKWHAEAANALLLHADLLEFTDEGREEKVKLYEDAIQDFDHGQHFEQSIKLCKELLQYFQTETINYLEVSGMHTRMAKYYMDIAARERYFSSYFRCGFYGNFEDEIRNKDFIFRGEVLESIIDFTDRIRARYPGSSMLQPKKNGLDDTYANSKTERFLQISKVSGIPAQAMESGKVPKYLETFANNEDIKQFFYQRPFRKNEEKSANEFLDLWVEKFILTTDQTFPTTMRRQLVVKRERIVLNPLEMAVNGLLEKNQELNEKVAELEEMEDGTADQSYTMALNGVVDAAVNGGLANYEVFFTGAFIETNPEIQEDIDANPEKQALRGQLVDGLKEQLAIVEEGVAVHGFKCIEAMRPLHAHMAETFVKLKAQLLELLGEADGGDGGDAGNGGDAAGSSAEP